MIKKITFAILVILVSIQFVPIQKNESGTQTFDISQNYQVPDHVSTILQGACNGCPSSTFTLKSGIENMLKDMLKDEDIKVEAVNA